MTKFLFYMLLISAYLFLLKLYSIPYLSLWIVFIPLFIWAVCWFALVLISAGAYIAIQDMKKKGEEYERKIRLARFEEKDILN